METKGIDVSSYQGMIDWEKVASAGYKYAVLRCITRSGVDHQFERNYTQAKNAGLKVGVYAFSYALTKDQAVKEAERVANLLNGRVLELPVYLDLEWGEQRKLGKEQLTDIAQAFLQTVKNNTAYQVGIYCNTDWYNNVLDPSALPYDYWIASYGINNGNPNRRPDVPGMTAWQYTSQGNVPGISGKVDLDVFYKVYPYTEFIEKSGWQQEEGGWRYYLGNGQQVRNDWYWYKGKWYWFDGSGMMVHDTWYKYKEHWYYLGADGAMVTGQQTIDGKWYVMDNQGRMIVEPVTLTPDQDGALRWPGMAE